MIELFGWVRGKCTAFARTKKWLDSLDDRVKVRGYKLVLPSGELVCFKTMLEAVKWKERVAKAEVEELYGDENESVIHNIKDTSKASTNTDDGVAAADDWWRYK